MKYISSIVFLILFTSDCNASNSDFSQLEKEHKRTRVSLISDANARLDSFKKSAYWSKTQKVEVLSCSKLLKISVVNSRGNTSYGGECSVKLDKKVQTAFICNDEMVGHFQVQPLLDKSYSDLTLASFVYSNCYGG